MWEKNNSVILRTTILGRTLEEETRLPFFPSEIRNDRSIREAQTVKVTVIHKRCKREEYQLKERPIPKVLANYQREIK